MLRRTRSARHIRDWPPEASRVSVRHESCSSRTGCIHAVFGNPRGGNCGPGHRSDARDRNHVGGQCRDSKTPPTPTSITLCFETLTREGRVGEPTRNGCTFDVSTARDVCLPISRPGREPIDDAVSAAGQRERRILLAMESDRFHVTLEARPGSRSTSAIQASLCRAGRASRPSQFVARRASRGFMIRSPRRTTWRPAA
jgi:hypothetical protein